MRIVLIGANGNFGLKRLKAMQRSADHVTAICDLKFERALQVCSQEGVVLETDYHRLLDQDFEVAVVSLPDHVKLPVVADFLAAGKHVIVEKPLAMRVSDVQRLFALARERGVSLYVGYNMRFFPSVAKLLELTRERFFGPIHHVRLFYGHGGVHSLVDAQKWQLTASSWGGAFVDMGSHLLSILSYLIPRIDSGILERQHIVSPGVEDHGVAQLKADGCIAEVTGSWTSWRSRFAIEVYGSDGFAELDSLVKYIKYGHKGERIRYGRTNPAGVPDVIERVWGLSSSEEANSEIIDSFTADVECLDQEWQWLRANITNGTFDMAKEEQVNSFVADVYERLYR